MPDDLSAALDEIRERARAFAFDVMECTGAQASADDVPRLLAAIDALLELHSEWRIFEECDHARPDGEIGCADCYCYSVCRSCCAGDGSGQTEQCASDHDLMNCWPCPTYQAISRALLGGTDVAQ